MNEQSLLDLDAIEARANAATPGPWRWLHDRFNDRYARPKRDGGRAARAGHRLRDLWVGLLCGPSGQASWHKEATGLPPDADDPDWLDEWDYPQVWALRWADVRGSSIAGPATPSPADREFIAHAREDVPALVAEVRDLRGKLAKAWRDWDDLCLAKIDLESELEHVASSARSTRESMGMQREPSVTFYKDGDHFATVTNTTDPDEFLTECAAALGVALENHLGDFEFQLNGLLPQVCEIWAKLKGYKADRVFEQRILIAGTPNPSAHMRPMNTPRPAVALNGHAAETGEPATT